MTLSPLIPRRRSKRMKVRSNLPEKEGTPESDQIPGASEITTTSNKPDRWCGVRGSGWYSRGSLVVEVEGDGDALDAGLGAGERHLLVRDDEGRVGRRGGGGGEAEEEEGDEREGPRHGWAARARWLGLEGSQLRRRGGGNGSRLACSLASSTGNRAPPPRGVTRPVRLHVGPATQDHASSVRMDLDIRIHRTNLIF